jgi:hypothetical protein
MDPKKRQFAGISSDSQFGIALFIKEPINEKTLKLQCLEQAKIAENPMKQAISGS